MSREMKPSQQGQMQGAIQSLRGLAGIAGPVMFTYVFSMTFGPRAAIHAPGSAFYLAAGLLAASLLMAQWIRSRKGSAVTAA
jgi:DHA1 family tetracycline resistance protein-like MFS transporter